MTATSSVVGVQHFNPSFGEGGVRVCSDAVLRYFFVRFAVILFLTRGFAVLQHFAVCGYYNF